MKRQSDRIQQLKGKIASLVNLCKLGIKKYVLALLDLEAELANLLTLSFRAKTSGVNVNMKIFQKIESLSEPSAREVEILGDKRRTNLAGINPKLIQELRALQLGRENKRNEAIAEGWRALKERGYKKVSYTVNSAVASGHSDYDDPFDRVSRQGIESPDGTFLDGGAGWQFAILPALKHADI